MALDFLPQGFAQVLPQLMQGMQAQQQQPAMQPQAQNPAGPGFFDKLKATWADPNVRQAVMTTGLNLMRSPGYGQSGWDVGADALGAGLGTLQQLRERDRKQKLETEDRAIKENQRGIENKRAETQVGISQQNADTNKTNIEGDIEGKKSQLAIEEKKLAELIRHNGKQEEIDMVKARADQLRATIYGNTQARTPAEIEKINRLKAFYKQKNPGISDEEADKQAMDYLSTAKGKSPRQLVIDAFQKKASAWMEQQLDPEAQPTPEMRDAWKKQSIEEVKFAEEAGSSVTDTRGVINRPAASSQASKDPTMERNVATWKAKGGTPDQIKTLIQKNGGDPKLYGY